MNTKPKHKKEDGFEQRERVGKGYWDDPRWKEVHRLHKENKILEANSLVSKIHDSWGVE